MGHVYFRFFIYFLSLDMSLYSIIFCFLLLLGADLTITTWFPKLLDTLFLPPLASFVFMDSWKHNLLFILNFVCHR